MGRNRKISEEDVMDVIKGENGKTICVKEIADQLGCHQATVRSRMKNLRRKKNPIFPHPGRGGGVYLQDRAVTKKDTERIQKSGNHTVGSLLAAMIIAHLVEPKLIETIKVLRKSLPKEDRKQLIEDLKGKCLLIARVVDVMELDRKLLTS